MGRMRAFLKIAGLGALALLVILRVPRAMSGDGSPASQAVPESATEFLSRLATSLQANDIPSYLQAFPAEVRAAEKARLDGLFLDQRMERGRLWIAGMERDADGRTRAFVRAVFENAFMALSESWLLTLVSDGESWSVAAKEVVGGPAALYKLRLPAERSERARRVEVRHKDIVLTFADAAVFFDNIPHLETALIVIGRGRVRFTPSDRNERHQLELLFKKPVFEDEIDSLYLRASPSFFGSNVSFQADEGRDVTVQERDRAAAVFAHNYARSFTVESSFGGELLSLLPQGDEAVLEFPTRRSGELTYVFSPFAEDEISFYDRGRDRVISLYSPVDESEPQAKRMFISFAEKFDITDYALELSYSPADAALAGRARIVAQPKVEALDSLNLRFNPALEIVRIVDEKGRRLFTTQDRVRRILYVYFPVLRTPAAPAVIEIVYRGRMKPVPPSTDVLGQPGVDQSIRFRPRYETFFFSHVGDWYPGPVDDDFFRARLRLIFPSEYEAISVGAPGSEGLWEEPTDTAKVGRPGGSGQTFASRAPVKTFAFILGRFDRRKAALGAVPIQVHVSTEAVWENTSLAGQAAEVLDFYRSAFGPYPFDKLDVVVRAWPTAGGHSPPSFVILNGTPWTAELGFAPAVDTPIDLSEWDEYFLAHEIAHQWWGQGVSFATFKDQWLSEGLAQFSAALFLRHKYGDKAFPSILKKFSRWTEKKSFRGPIVMGSRLSHSDYQAYQAIVYNKTALVLFMLRDLIGPETFASGLRSFFEGHAFTAARTGQFIAAMERAAGRSLRGFFQGWFYDHELPRVRTSWTLTDLPDGARLDLRIVQDNGPFEFPLWVEWRGPGGGTGRAMVVVDKTSQTIALTLPRRPDKVRVNPDAAVPGRFD